MDEPLHHDWHSLEADEALDALGADAVHGLDDSTVAERLARHGFNELPESRRRSHLRTFLDQFRSPLIYILFIAATFAFALGRHGDAAVILAVVLINALVGWFQEGRAARAMEALRKLSSPQSRVFRSGGEQLIATRLLVPGDILLLAAGDRVGADARLIEAMALEAAEAVLTGESLPVVKMAAPLPRETFLADRANMVYSGTHVTTGRGRAVVTATGATTEVGRIAGLTGAARPPRTPLEISIAQFGHYVVAAAIVLFVAVMSFGLLRGIDTVEIFMVAVSQMVSMVPEGLPVAMTIALAVGMQRMARRGVIVRRLAAVETLGSISVICADKTGTLTRNEMAATAMWLPPGRWLDVDGTGYEPRGEIREEDRHLDVARDPALLGLLRVAALCNDARLVPPDATDARWRALGDPTEAALLALAGKAGIDLDALRHEWRRHDEIPFDAEAGMMATLHSDAGDRFRFIAFKGAPEAVIDLCEQVATCTGAAPLGPQERADALHAAASLAGRALRVLAFARADGGWPDASRNFRDLRSRLVLLGLVGEMDPPREEVRLSVVQCQQAGMRAVMATGDHRATGLAVARVLGIAREGDRAIDGSELDRMPDAELRAAIPGTAVFTRVRPEQKLRIVEALQAGGERVAMTGDGVNDAPALIRADVGVAMGRSGTEVAKAAAGIVITDDNFSTIVTAVREGRLVHRNLGKVLLYLIATSLDEVIVLLTALLAGYPLPLAAVQILWINIVTESTVALSLIIEPPEGDEMLQKPVERNRRLLGPDLLRRLALMSPVMALSTFGWFAWRVSAGAPLAQVQTETFAVLACCQWFNVLNCRSATRSAFRFGLFTNPWVFGGLLLSVALQALVIYWPPMNVLFHTTPIAFRDLPLIVAVASAVLWTEELRKLIARRRPYP